MTQVRFDSGADGQMTVTLLPPDPAGWRPTERMEVVSRVLERTPQGLSKTNLRDQVGGKTETTDEAIRLLVPEFVQIEKQGQASVHLSVRPYRAESDEPRPPDPTLTHEQGQGSGNASGDPDPRPPLWGSGSGPRTAGRLKRSTSSFPLTHLRMVWNVSPPPRSGTSPDGQRTTNGSGWLALVARLTRPPKIVAEYDDEDGL